MANLQHSRKVGAHTNQETRRYHKTLPTSVVVPDSQPPRTGQKRKHRTLSPEQQDSQQVQYRDRNKRRRTSDSGRDQANRFPWDSLSRVWLARDAIWEFDRRNRILAAKSPQKVDKREPQIPARDIEQFARHGGPDLSDLRQYSNSLQDFTEPTETSESTESTESTEATESSESDSMPRKAGKKSSGRSVRENPEQTESLRRATAYTPNFAQILADDGIFSVDRDCRAANHREWNEVLIQPRPSLSPSRMSDGHYYRFVKAADVAETEDEVMSHVIPKIVGEPRHLSRQNVKLTNLYPLTKDIVCPQPDYYEGHRPGPGNRQLRARLDKDIVPSSHKHYPFLPNFFAEAKSREGSLAVAQRQACHDGALGARAMHRLENLERPEEFFDNEARTASVVYSGAGALDIFSHHLSQPRGAGTLTQTHMTPLRSFSLADNPGSLRQAVGAFRNASDYASQPRKDSIEDAHRRGRIITPKPPSTASRPTRTPLSCQTPVAVSSDSDSDSSSEEEESDNGDYSQPSRAHPRGRLLSPKVVIATPKRLASRDLTPPRRDLRPRRRS